MHTVSGYLCNYRVNHYFNFQGLIDDFRECLIIRGLL
jgi:hypothetical protein